VGSTTDGARLRAWFLRNLLDAAERELGPASIASLAERAPTRVRAHLSLDRLRASSALDTISLDEGEEAILAFDQTLGDGSGRTLERVACEMFARQLLQAVSAVRVGDLFGTVARLRAPIEHPFVDVPVVFELTRTDSGFRLNIGMAGRPRAARILGHIATGAIHAAERFARETHTEILRLELTTFADRARVDAHYLRASSPPPAPDPVPASRRSSGAMRLPSLSDEVARILDSSLSNASRPPSEAPPPRRAASDRPPPSAPPASQTPDTQPTSDPPRPAGTERRSTRPPPR
jgi:hypothetical protein